MSRSIAILVFQFGRARRRKAKRLRTTMFEVWQFCTHDARVVSYWNRWLCNMEYSRRSINGHFASGIRDGNCG
jgi:hypothetical protein